MFSGLLFVSYYLVAIFYMLFGALLISSPHLVEHRIHSLFPLLASFKLQRIANAINLIVVGVILVIVGHMMASSNVLGFFFALILSAWEVYLGVMFYYLEKKDIPQAIIHFVLHSILTVAVGVLIIYTYSSQVEGIKEACMSTVSSFLHIWNY